MTAPSGVVTFLMTDIVGSTPIWERAPHQMDVALQRHDALIDAAVAAHRGLTLRHRGEGDSTFSVFQSAADAVAAAHDAQRRLRAEQWPDETPIVVRMGIHAGEAIIRAGEYHGRVVNRAARVRSVARGGQILLSGAAAALVEDRTPPGTELRFVGAAVLRGIDGAEALHELVDPDLPELVELSPDDAAVATVPELIATAIPRVFSGRRDPLATLRAARRSSADEGRAVLIGGEPGVGKTALAAIAAVRAHEEGWTVLAGACEEAAGVPYGAMREVMRSAVEVAPRSVLVDHVVAHGGTVSRLTDRLAARLGALGPERSEDLETTRRLLADASVDLLRRCCAVRPVLMMIDDVQWADRNTLHLLEQLVSAAVPGLTVVATYRSGHAEERHFGAWLERLSRRDGTVTVLIGGLEPDELLRLVHSLAGHDIGTDGERLVAHLAAETGGNPFLVVEMLRLLVQQGVVGTDPGGRWGLLGDLDGTVAPHSARAVIAERLGRLGPETTRVLEAAAVLGREFDPLVIGAMLDVDEIAVLDRLEPALRASIVRELGPGDFQFGHALVQHALYDGVGVTRRGALHRRAAQALAEVLGPQISAAAIAGHWVRTGRAHDADVMAWCRRAGEDAMTALAPEDAVRWFERALTAADDATRLDLMIELGKAQRWVDGASFRSTLLAAAALAEQRGDGDALIRAALANHRGGASRAGAVDTERVEVLERALAAAGTGDSPERALLLATVAMERSQGSDIEHSISLADTALDVARRVDDEGTLFTVLLRITEAIRIPATLERRLAATDEMFDVAVQLDDPVQLGFAAVRDIRTKFEAAQFDRVDRAFRVLEEVSHLDPFVHHNHSSLRAVRAQFAGNLGQALEHAERARQLGDSENDAAAVYLSTASMIRWDMGTMAELLPSLEYICREFPGVVGFQPTAGLAHVAAGNDAAARAILLDAAERRFEHLPLNPLWAMTVSVFASLCIELGESDAAAQLHALMLPQRGRANISVVSGNGLVSESLAGLALVAGWPDEAIRHALDALAQAERLGTPLSTARSLLALARAQRAVGDIEAGRDHARAAGHVARTHGMELVTAQAEELLAALSE